MLLSLIEVTLCTLVHTNYLSCAHLQEGIVQSFAFVLKKGRDGICRPVPERHLYTWELTLVHTPSLNDALSGCTIEKMEEQTNLSSATWLARHKRLVFVVGVCSLILVTLLLVGFVFRNYLVATYTEVTTALGLPKELRGASFIANASDAVSATYAVVSGRFVKSTHPGSVIVSSDTHASNVSVVFFQNTGLYGIVYNGKTLLTSREPIASAALSPNGVQVAYAKQVEGKTGSRKAEDWEVMLYLMETNRTVRVSQGFAPFFIDNTHLARFTLSGIYGFDMVTGQQSELLKKDFWQFIPAFDQSPDRTLIAWSDPATKTTAVYRLGARAEQVLSIPEVMPLITLGNDALFRVRLTPEGTVISAYPLNGNGQSRMLYTFPKSLSINALVL